MSCKTFHFSLKLKELSAVPLSCPVFHHLCSAHSIWGFSLIPFSTSGSPLNSLSVLAVGRGKTHSSLLISSHLISSHSPSAVLPSLPRKLPVWSDPVCWGRAALGGTSWTLERDNRRTRLPQAASHACLQYKAGLQGHILTPCKKQSSRSWVQQGGKVLTPCLKGWKISLLLGRWCWLCADIWHTDPANRLSKVNTTNTASWLL